MIWAILLAATLLACTSEASTLDPAGPRAARTAQLTWIMTFIGAAVYAAVLAVIAAALVRARAGQPLIAAPSDAKLIVGGGILLPAIVIPLLWVLTLRDIAATLEPPSEPVATIEVVGHQWWYEVRYPGHGVVLRDEMHIPAGAPVRLRVTSADVIHSFWIPRLMGKIDMIPGRTNDYWVQADGPGEYEVRCAEFCGLWHARMRMTVTAMEREAFERWLGAARAQGP